MIGPFCVRRALASGTLGPRLLVEDERGRLQVLKLISDVIDDGDALARVLDHVRKSLPAHPGLLPVTDVGVAPDGVYLVSPVVEAPTIEGRLRGGRQTLEEALAWLRGVVAGLQAAHEAGVWHGAIHPRDVLVSEDGGVLTGVGVAPALEHLALQAPVRVPYTAPERASGQRWDARADQYSLAMLALDALSGRRLIAGTIPAFDRWTLAETPTEDARLHEVFVRALHPDPAQRYDSVEQWLGALAGAVPEAGQTGQDGALSRFAREGVILATPAVAESATARDIEVQTLEDPEGVALSLFPEEDGTTESPVPPVAGAPPGSDTPEAEPEAEQEWLVADVPPDEPTTDATDALALHGVAGEAAPAAGEPLVTTPAWRLDDDDTVIAGGGASASSWDPAPEEAARRGPWLLLVAGLVLVALAYGTWRSVQRPDASDDGASVSSSVPAPGPSTADDPPVSESPRRESPAQATPPTAAPRPVPQAPVPPREARQAEAARPVTSSRAPAGATPAPSGDAAPVAGAGRVLIRSSPAGEVRVNGRPRGETPVVLRDLPFGSYVISVSRPGFAPVERAIDLLPSQPSASITVDLARQGAEVSQGQATAGDAGVSASSRPAAATPEVTRQPAAGTRVAASNPGLGSIFVVSTPAQARLYVDGQLYGSTPASIPGLTPGSHAVRIEAAGYRPWAGQVDVMPGTRTRVQATLQQEQE